MSTYNNLVRIISDARFVLALVALFAIEAAWPEREIVTVRVGAQEITLVTPEGYFHVTP